MYTPLNPTFIKQNWGMQGCTYFSYFCSKTDCGYSLEPPRRDFSDEIFIFATEKNLCILHGQVFVMCLPMGPFGVLTIGKNGTIGRQMSFNVLAMVPLVIPLVPMVPMLPTCDSK